RVQGQAADVRDPGAAEEERGKVVFTESPMHDLAAEAKKLLEEQKQEWPLLRENVAALASVQTRAIEVDDFVLKVQFNPARLASTAAKTDAQSIRQRKCFLCQMNRPPEQRDVRFGDDYLILCNPFPIFPKHFTVTH